MSITNTYMQKGQQFNKLQKELEKLKNEDRLKAGLEFCDKLEVNRTGLL
ncbi:hypothetical protein [Vreelandella nigrificans]|nr:hypothetical protein [Halomonas nigrificans]